MSTVHVPLAAWNASHSYTANGDVTIVLSNIGGQTARYDFDNGTALPTIAVNDGHPIKRGTSVSIGLKSGQTVFWAGPSNVLVGVLN